MLVSQRLSYQKQYSSLWRLRSIVIVFAYHDKIQPDIYIYIYTHTYPYKRLYVLNDGMVVPDIVVRDMEMP